ncbi:MAG: hypothetical protein RLZZ175_2216 [Bacteroidota bacterium]|jgi:PAS domain S-box-containing protein
MKSDLNNKKLQLNESISGIKNILFIASFLYIFIGAIDSFILNNETDFNFIQRVIIGIIAITFTYLRSSNQLIKKHFEIITQAIVVLASAHIIYLVTSCHYAISHIIELIILIVIGSLAFSKIKQLYIYHGFNTILLFTLSHLITNPEIDFYTYLGIFISIFATVLLATYISLEGQIKIKNELKSSQSLLLGIFEGTSDALILANTENGNIIECNQSTIKLLGFNDKAEILNKTLSSLLFKHFPEKNIEEINEIEDESEFWQGNQFFSFEENSFWGHIHVKKIVINQQNTFLIRITDISEQVKANEEIVINETRLAASVEAAKQGLLEWDINNNNIYINDIWKEITHISNAISFTEAWEVLPADEDKEMVQQALTAHINNISDHFDIEFKLHPIAENYTQWVSARGHLIEKENSKKLIITLQDITLRKELQKEKELAEIAAENKAMFLSNMSHEIRTPINAVLSLSTMILDEPISDKAKEYIRLIKYSSDNLLAIVNDILDFSKVDSGNIEFEHIAFNLKSLINDFSDTNSIKAKEKGLQFDVNFDSQVPQIIYGDPHRLNQILMNLVSNAIKFTQKGTIGLTVNILHQKDKQSLLHFKVSDTGIGIPREKLGIIFQSFMQADTSTTREFGGTGLGLTITQKLVQLQGGNIQVHSHVGKGSVFSFTIPYEIADESSLEPQNNEELDKDKLSKIHVLLVEDNEINQYVAIQIFDRFKVQYQTAFESEEAFDKLEKSKFDVILLDIQLPGKSGFDIAKEIRNNSKYELNQNTPIVALTANAFDEIKQKALRVGMNDFVTKPFTPEVLLKAINLNVKNKNISILPEPNIPIESPKNTITESENWVLNLDLLRQLTNNNLDNMRVMINMFVTETPKELIKIKDFLEELNFHGINRTVHAMKPRFTYMGDPSTSKLCANIELLTIDNQCNNLDELKSQLLTLENKCEILLKELKKELI